MPMCFHQQVFIAHKIIKIKKPLIKSLIGPLSTFCNCEKSFSIFPTLISSGTPIQIRDAQIEDDLKLIDCTGRIFVSSVTVEEIIFCCLLKNKIIAVAKIAADVLQRNIAAH